MELSDYMAKLWEEVKKVSEKTESPLEKIVIRLGPDGKIVTAVI